MGATGMVVAAAAALGGAAYVVVHLRAERARLRRRLAAATTQLEHLQTSFARFAPREVVERIVARGVSTEADHREVTVLFADLVGFTGLAETLAPDALVAILNDYFVRMSRVIGDHRGHVGKFIGDGLMALFGALEPNPWQADDAVHAALGMRRALAAYNDELTGRGMRHLRFGIGIHRGVAVAGVIGSHELMEFTVIGQPVNLAARVERLTRVHDTDILITSAVRSTLDPRFVLRELPPRTARGVSEPVVTWAVERFEE